MRRRWVVILVVLAALAAGGLCYAIIKAGLLNKQNLAPPAAPNPIISTRGHFNDGKLTRGHTRYDYSITGSLPGLTPKTDSPHDLVIIIHGFNNEPDKAIAKTAIAAEGLWNSGYAGAVAGYSWDADTQEDPLKMTGTHEALRNAKGNGSKLAQFLLDYKKASPLTRIHIVGYSMGAQLALDALKALDEDKAFKDAQLKVDTVFLLGAFADREEVESGYYGKAIERRAGTLWNYYSPKDAKLGLSYMVKELHHALGVTDLEHLEKKPANYRSRDVSAELLTYDSAGKLIPEKTGENHSDYLGQRDAQMNLKDDGVMDLVAEEIRKAE